MKGLKEVSIINKVFGDLYYDQTMSEYHTKYCIAETLVNRLD